jgi:hypothetical protein
MLVVLALLFCSIQSLALIIQSKATRRKYVSFTNFYLNALNPSTRSWLLGAAVAVSSSIVASLVAILFFPFTTLLLLASFSFGWVLLLAAAVLAPASRICSVLAIAGSAITVSRICASAVHPYWKEYLNHLAIIPATLICLACLYTVSRRKL